MTHISRICMVAIAAVASAGCASIDYEYPRQASSALTATEATDLGRDIRPLTANKPPDQSGFLVLNNGVDALAARLLLAQRAEASIDAQYYLIKNDITGRAFIYSLLQAADRGVRVRLLVDDMFTKGYDVGLAALDSHPNFEIRIFNPFKRGRTGRGLGAATEFRRINRRMHNKSFTIDNQITVLGGRNIADEYFGAREDAKFGDVDVAAIGPLVNEVSDSFDVYWNHETALPVPAFADELDDPAAALDALRQRLRDSRDSILDSKFAGAVKSKILQFLEADANALTWAPYRLVVDSPDKGISAKAKEAGSMITPLRDALAAADSEVILISPYFVPRKTGVAAFSELQQSGVDVTIVTNSLAANNQFAVHAGYAPSRKPLLISGVKIFEARPDADVAGTEFVDASGAKATLHTKAFIVDRRDIFIGSFNFDPRSANINTEIGVIITHAGLAADLTTALQAKLATETYEVFLNDDGKLRWRTYDDGQEIIYRKEPETSWAQRASVSFMRILPIRGQL